MKILVSPLDWGLGHATRCIPLIRKLQQAGHTVLIAADKGPAALLKQEFPALEHIPFPGLEIRYPENGNMVAYMIKTAPALMLQTAKEQKQTEEIVRRHQVDLIISDNRYGVYSTKIPSVFITHQLFIRGTENTRWLEPLIRFLTWQNIRNFDACWIPDFPESPSLAEELSHGKILPLKNTQYIGSLSRFQDILSVPTEFEIPPLLCVLSGPEPMRTRLEEIFTLQARENNFKALMILGKPAAVQAFRQEGNLSIISHLPAAQFKYCLERCELLIARSGYSTVMDVQVTGTPAVWIPTPGQTEQEYLAELYQKQGWYYSAAQKDFNLVEAIQQSKSFTPPRFPTANVYLEEAVNGLNTFRKNKLL